MSEIITKPTIVKPQYSYPVLPWNKYNNNVGKFLDREYYKLLNAEHPGADLNRNTGGNTDWGDPIYAIATGIVSHARFYPVWGNIVEIYHPGPKVWSMYAHLEEIKVRQYQEVDCQDLIGTLGRGAKNRYIAHLHFEIRYKDTPVDYWPSAYFPNRLQAQAEIKARYVDPIKFLAKNNAATTLIK